MNNMPNQFLTYKRFNDASLVEAITGLLTDNGIVYEIEDNSKYFDVSFAQNNFASGINLKIQAADFTRADKVLESYFDATLEEVDKDYYLHSFTNEELSEIISKPDEWGQFDYQLAQKLLSERGITIDTQELELLKFRRNYELAEPEPAKNTWLILGYSFTIIGSIFTILGGFIGILTGWILAYFKKTLPDGQVVYTYDEAARKQGKYLLAFSIIITAVFYFWRLSFLRS